MNDAQSTVVGLKAQDCPGGGWNGMPAELEVRCTVTDCLASGTCGCIYGDAVQHIERLRAALEPDALRYALEHAGLEVSDGELDAIRQKLGVVVQQSAPSVKP